MNITERITAFIASDCNDENEEKAILNALQSLGFDYEDMPDNMAEHFLHCTQIEIWQYYLEHIVPALVHNSISVNISFGGHFNTDDLITLS